MKTPNNNQDTPSEAKFDDGTVNVPSKQKEGPVFDDQGEFTLSVWVLFVSTSQDSNPVFFF